MKALTLFGSEDARTVIAGGELCADTIRHGSFGRIEWTPIPTHLPNSDEGLREIVKSKGASDRQMRIDVMEWRIANESKAMQMATRVEVCVWNFWRLMTVHKSEEPKDASPALLELLASVRPLQVEIWTHCRSVFDVDISRPEFEDVGRDDFTHLVEIVSESSPIPTWLRGWSGPRRFVPSKRSTSDRGGKPVTTGTLFGGGDLH